MSNECFDVLIHGKGFTYRFPFHVRAIKCKINITGRMVRGCFSCMLCKYVIIYNFRAAVIKQGVWGVMLYLTSFKRYVIGEFILMFWRCFESTLHSFLLLLLDSVYMIRCMVGVCRRILASPNYQRVLRLLDIPGFLGWCVGVEVG